MIKYIFNIAQIEERKKKKLECKSLNNKVKLIYWLAQPQTEKMKLAPIVSQRKISLDNIEAASNDPSKN